VSLERGPLSLVRITEEVLELKNSGFGSRKPRLTAVGIGCADRVTLSIHKSRHYDKQWSLGRFLFSDAVGKISDRAGSIPCAGRTAENIQVYDGTTWIGQVMARMFGQHSSERLDLSL
jgi:hypothetical protein